MEDEIFQQSGIDKKKLTKVLKFDDEKDFAMYEEVTEIKEHLEGIHESLKFLAEKPKEMPETHKVEIEGVEVITLKGDKGDTGEKGEQGERGLDGKDGKNGRDGKDGKDGLDGKDGIDGKDGENGKDGSPDTPEQIIEKINSSEEQIDKERIKGLEEEIKKLRNDIKAVSAKGGVRRVFQPYVDDFSGDTDGITKTFYLSREPLKTNTILVWGTDFPVILRPTVDFTVSGKTLTLTSAIQAPSQGATLLIQYYA